MIFWNKIKDSGIKNKLNYTNCEGFCYQILQLDFRTKTKPDSDTKTNRDFDTKNNPDFGMKISQILV